MARALSAARADELVGLTPAASTSAVAWLARPRAFQGAWRAWARSTAIDESVMSRPPRMHRPRSGGAHAFSLRRHPREGVRWRYRRPFFPAFPPLLLPPFFTAGF